MTRAEVEIAIETRRLWRALQICAGTARRPRCRTSPEPSTEMRLDFPTSTFTRCAAPETRALIFVMERLQHVISQPRMLRLRSTTRGLRLDRLPSQTPVQRPANPIRCIASWQISRFLSAHAELVRVFQAGWRAARLGPGTRERPGTMSTPRRPSTARRGPNCLPCRPASSGRLAGRPRSPGKSATTTAAA